LSISIIADDRERQSQVFCDLTEHDQLELCVKRLAVGDYLLNQRLLFERKTLPDLKQSIVDGRFFRQAIRLASSEYTPVLVLEGSHYDPPGPEVSREAVQGALINVSLILGVSVLRSLSSRETAWLMIRADKQVQRVAEGAVHRPATGPKAAERDGFLFCRAFRVSAGTGLNCFSKLSAVWKKFLRPNTRTLFR